MHCSIITVLPIMDGVGKGTSQWFESYTPTPPPPPRTLIMRMRRNPGHVHPPFIIKLDRLLLFILITLVCFVLSDSFSSMELNLIAGPSHLFVPELIKNYHKFALKNIYFAYIVQVVACHLNERKSWTIIPFHSLIKWSIIA